MKRQTHDKAGLPDFTNKVVSVSIAGEDDGRCLEHPRWATQGGRLFLIGTVPRAGSSNNWCGGIRAQLPGMPLLTIWCSIPQSTILSGSGSMSAVNAKDNHSAAGKAATALPLAVGPRCCGLPEPLRYASRL
jgi:hypothetical protein